MNSTKLLLLRHGEVANAPGRFFNGHHDIGLSKDGIYQYEIIAKTLSKKNIDAIYSSDLKRAYNGAEMIANHHNIPVAKIRELRELNYGIWEGKTVEHVMENYKEEMVKRQNDIVNHRVKDGETLQELHDRVIPVVNAILTKELGKKIVMVAHGGVNRTILLWAMKSSLKNFYSIRQDYGALNILSFYENGHIEVEAMNLLLYEETFAAK